MFQVLGKKIIVTGTKLGQIWLLYVLLPFIINFIGGLFYYNCSYSCKVKQYAVNFPNYGNFITQKLAEKKMKDSFPN